MMEPELEHTLKAEYLTETLEWADQEDMPMELLQGIQELVLG